MEDEYKEMPEDSNTKNYIYKTLEEKGLLYMGAFSLASILVALDSNPPQGEEELEGALELSKECMKGVLILICEEVNIEVDKLFDDLDISNKLLREERDKIDPSSPPPCRLV